ncbi:MAG: polysaccharide pyruvyl transferase family protein [Clostridium sp.]|nr:polysaccharide pyruvyl transferase family protein [Clostridium sp.]
MKKIAVMGLTDLVNFGERFLADTVVYLVGDQYDVSSIDFRPKKKTFGYLIFGISVIASRILSFWEKSAGLILFGVRCYTKRYYKKQLKECDAIIFACGSYKYGTQKLWAYYSVVIEVAEKYSIPVMFDAVNVQDFNDKDWRCRCLKQHTNYSCVKCITTRDGMYGLEKLRTCYLKQGTKIHSEAVGDPAFWIPECYGVKRKKNNGKIGVNLIRTGVFADYGLKVTEEQLVDIYCKLIKRLEQEHVEWEFFTNGLPVDYMAGRNILQKCGMPEREIVVPESAKELVEIIAGYKGIIGARLHACICAYSLDVPLAGFIWDEKMLRFAQIARLEQNFLKEEELTGDAIYERLREMLNKDYDRESRNSWKQKTKDSIDNFIIRC